MAHLVVDKDGTEIICKNKPIRFPSGWEDTEGEYEAYCDYSIILPSGSIHKLIGQILTWEDEPVELK